MTTLATVVNQLRKEGDQVQKRIQQLDQALRALTGAPAVRATSGQRGRGLGASLGRRTLSSAARKRIAAAQRARWAKWKAGRKTK